MCVHFHLDLGRYCYTFDILYFNIHCNTKFNPHLIFILFSSNIRHALTSLISSLPLPSHDYIGEFSTSYRELSTGQSQFYIFEVNRQCSSAIHCTLCLTNSLLCVLEFCHMGAHVCVRYILRILDGPHRLFHLPLVANASVCIEGQYTVLAIERDGKVMFMGTAFASLISHIHYMHCTLCEAQGYHSLLTVMLPTVL